MGNMRSPHEILGIDKLAAHAEIIAAYRRLAMKWHPDRNSSPVAAARFQEIQSAYRTLQSRPTLWEDMPFAEAATDASLVPSGWRHEFPLAAAACLAGGVAALFLSWPGNLLLFSLALLLAYNFYKSGTSAAARQAEEIFKMGVKLYWTGLLIWGVWTMGQRVAGV